MHLTHNANMELRQWFSLKRGRLYIETKKKRTQKSVATMCHNLDDLTDPTDLTDLTHLTDPTGPTHLTGSPAAYNREPPDVVLSIHSLSELVGSFAMCVRCI